jgi:hypothetical protein
MGNGALEVFLDARGCCSSARCVALEALWRALSDSENTRIGYNPAVAEACEVLRRMDSGEPEPKTLPLINTDKSTDIRG